MPDFIPFLSCCVLLLPFSSLVVCFVRCFKSTAREHKSKDLIVANHFLEILFFVLYFLGSIKFSQLEHKVSI